MKGFLLDNSGDVVIDGGNGLQLVEGNYLVAQTMRQVIGTNVGEWFLNEDEGIHFELILVKNPDMEVVRNEIVSAITQIDESFCLVEFDYEITKERKLLLRFTAKNASDELITYNSEKPFVPAEIPDPLAIYRELNALADEINGEKIGGDLKDKLLYLKQTKKLIRKAIEEIGVTVDDTDTFRSYSEKILQAENGEAYIKGEAYIDGVFYDDYIVGEVE